MISILIPSYGRAARIRSVVENAHKNTLSDHEILVVNERRYAEIPEYGAALYGLPGVNQIMNTKSECYGGAINTAIERAAGDYVFMGADDLNFHNGWDVPALETMLALPHIKVVGTNDLLNEYVLKGWHSTHSLVDRRYIEDPGGVVDGVAGQALFEGYTHNYVDTEFIGTAKARSVFAPCLRSVVEHNHYTVGKSSVDPTYLKGNQHLQEDHDLYESRKHLWWEISR